MNKNIEKAIEAQKNYKKNPENPFKKVLQDYGYEDYSDFKKDKREYLITNWNPNVYRWDLVEFPTQLEEHVRDKKYGVYISETKGTCAIHGNDYINYDLCKSLGVSIIEIPFLGGTGITSEKDLVIQFIIPAKMEWNSDNFLEKFKEIIDKYEENVTIHNNDILIDNKKVLGSMQRFIGNETIIFGAWVSFGEYEDLIEKICNKKSNKKPGHFSNLTKDLLEMEILKWLKIEKEELKNV